MEKQTEKFRCPYCGKVKDISEKNYNTEYGNFRPTTEKLGDIRDAYDYKHSNYRYTQYEVPICDDCLIIHNEAGFKANIIALCVFLPIAFYLLTRYSGFWEFIIPTGFIGVVCVFVRWLCKAFLVSRKGIYYHAHNNISYTSIEDDPINKYLTPQDDRNDENDIYEMMRKEREAFEKSIEEWHKTHRTAIITPNDKPKYYQDDEISKEKTLSADDFPDEPGYTKEVRDGVVYYMLDD